MIDKIKVYCNNCSSETNHEVLCEKKFKHTDDEQGIWIEYDYKTLQCMGCDSIILQESSRFSEDMEVVEQKPDGTGIVDIPVRIIYYPKRNSSMIKLYEDYYKFPTKIREIYQETIKSFNENLRILTAIGVRGIIESFCLEEGISEGNLKQKIEKLNSKKIISDNQKKYLDEIKFLGNEGAHQMQVYGDAELRSSIKIISDILEMHYSHPELFEKIKKRSKK